MTDPTLPASHGRIRWLRAQIDLWVSRGIIGAAEGDRIAAAYGTPGMADARRARTLFFALCGLALLMFSAGLLLLIGYNWEALPRAARVGLVFTAVTLAFTASSAAYAHARPAAGELLAFVGTLFYGNAIWLLAQVYHIESHWPDGAMWWGLGALLVAHLLSSRITGLQAVALLTIWTLMEAGFYARRHLLFLPALALLIWLAMRLRSAVLMVASLGSGALWITVMTGSAFRAPMIAAPMAALAGCAIHAAGIGIARPGWPARAVQACGIVVILIALVPATFTETHTVSFSWVGPIHTWGVGLAAGLLAIFVATVFLKRRPEELRRAFAIPAVALVSIVPMGRLAGLGGGPRYPFVMAVIFSAASVAMGVWLILRGVRMDRGWSFFGGVIYILLFVMVRWMDLIGDMITSSLVFFAASLVLIGTAFFWRRRAAAATGGDRA